MERKSNLINASIEYPLDPPELIKKGKRKLYRGEGWEIRVGKWQDSSPEADGADHIITDPPYDERTHKGAYYNAGDTFGGIEFPPLHPASIVGPFLQIATRWVVCFCTAEMIGQYNRAAGDACWIRAGWWRANNRSPQRSGDRGAVPGDSLAIMHRPGKKAWNGGGKHAYWEHNVCRGERRFHKTQKPLGLMLELCEDFTDKGELVWDPFGGSMTMGEACIILGRRYLAHEMDEEMAAMGAWRLKAAEHGLTLEAAQRGQTSLLSLS